MKIPFYMLPTLLMLSSYAGNMMDTPSFKTMNNNKGKTMAEKHPIIQQLNILLANEYVLYTKTLKFHWNVTGSFFGPLHFMFGDQYEQLQMYIDRIAERIRALNEMPAGTLSEFIQLSTLEEAPGLNPDDMSMIKLLLKDHEAIIMQLKAISNLADEHDDKGSCNMLDDLIEKHEKTAWMLRAHLKR